MQRTTGDTPGPGERSTQAGGRTRASTPVAPRLATAGLLTATLLATALAIGATAAEVPGGTVAPANPAPATPAAQGSGAAPATRTADADDATPPPPPANAPRRSPDVFVPTESVPEDRPIAFPVDI